MPNDRRTYTSGSIIFLTLVAYDRIPFFSKADNPVVGGAHPTFLLYLPVSELLSWVDWL
ncbi:MAG TPA: hypothetical protein V6C65_40775 [Allocoleopsis sp.]